MRQRRFCWKNAIYMSMRNDLSFVIDFRLGVYEHQSTYSPNLPLQCLMYVSDLYSQITKDENFINPGYNENLLHACRILGDYSEYTHRVRLYAKEMSLEEAVERAVSECVREGILADFLSKNRAEAIKVSIYEYDEERHMRFVREEGRDEGRSEGQEDILALMQRLFAAGRMEDAQRAAEDKEFCKKLLEEFGFTGV